MQRKKIYSIILIIIICFFILGIINYRFFINSFNKIIKGEDLPKFEYHYYEQTINGKYATLITFRDTNGIDKILYSDDNQKEIVIDCNNKTEVAIDYETSNFVHHYFTMVSKTGEKTINDLYLQVSINDFSYTGNVQTYTASISGNYKLEVWGAQGGDMIISPWTGIGGRGGYSSGNIHMEAGSKLFVYVGGQGQGYNGSANHYGGWNGGGTCYQGASGGGGATDIRTIGGIWNDTTSLNARIIVAGAGGGSNDHCDGGAGGGLEGLAGPNPKSGAIYGTPGSGGTQTSGGIGWINGSFGIGAGAENAYGDGGAGGRWLVWWW